MVLNTPNGEKYPATSEDSVFLEFPERHELLNGFWHDMDDQYMFISQHSPSYAFVLAAAGVEGGYNTLPLSPEDYSLEDTQIASIIDSVARFMIYSLEKELDEA